ncbi:MAG: glycosyltransferase [Saprospiraceae bacterium]|nr:glycosyltransferase [Saprospiraceae bacterium]
MSFLFALLSGCLLLQLLYPAIAVGIAQFRSIKPNQPARSEAIRFACIITAYQNATIARPLVQSLLQQTCPDFRIYLVADDCPEVDIGISDAKLVLLIPENPLRLKAKSIQFAIAHFLEQPDYIVIFDADNVAHPAFLDTLKPWIKAGFRCVQGQRRAKNLDSTFAALDSLGEHYKNYLEREVAFRLGSSAVISGSGMATERVLYTDYLYSPAIQQGQEKGKKMLQEDKILQNFLVQRNERIAYAREGIVFDEKVHQGAAVETQRSRWLYSYFQNIPNALGLIARGLKNGSFNQLYFGAITLVLPMFIQVGLATTCSIVALFFTPFWSLALILGLVVFALTVLWVLRLDKAPEAVRRVAWQTPVFVFRQIKALLKMRDPNRNFRHTEHRKAVTVEEVLEDPQLIRNPVSEDEGKKNGAVL